MTQSLEIFASTAPGLESLAAAELRALGITSDAVYGGVEWTGDARDVYQACLHLRVASRVLVRIGRFRARSFIELERHLGRIDWTRFLVPGHDVALRVSSGKSRLYHERAIAERVAKQLVSFGCHLFAGELPKETDDTDDAIGVVGGPREEEGSRPEEGAADGGGSKVSSTIDTQLIVVRFHRDECVVSIDASGALLHRRGYRQAIAKAPLRETLAAAMLMASGWKVTDPLVDPFCGSGTIPIEAALMARNLPPGLASPDHRPRSYAFQRWADFDAGGWDEIVRTARASVLPASRLPIRGSDRDAGAITAAHANAVRAGVADDIEITLGTISDLRCPDPEGWIVTNPPYGVRIGDPGPLRNLYTSMGRVVRDRCQGWSLAMLSADPSLTSRIDVDWREALRTANGGVPVKLLVSRV